MAIHKSPAQAGNQIKKGPVPDPLLKFSFKLFDNSDVEMCPAAFADGYTQTLMERLKDLSSWTVKRFTSDFHKTLRNHKLEWPETSRPHGFAHLNAVYRELDGWQFCLTANAHGRVHGVIIDDTFYVIWLDCNHRMYP
jgi:hypothetical protein